MPTSPPALLVIDVQRGFEDAGHWGRRNNPACEENIRALIDAWRDRGHPVVLVRHDSTEAGSPLAPGTPGNTFAPELDGVEPDLLLTKQTNSAFYGEPGLQAWLDERAITRLVLCGVSTNHCVETTARMAGNLGYDVEFVIDATYTFDRTGPDGVVVSADDLARATAASLHGEFATVLGTDAVLGAGVPS
jgi:nicotinamidase-related amidase